MARFLSLDWDHQQLHLVSAGIRGGSVQIQRAAVWAEEQSPNPGEAEALGKLLRERLKAAGIAPAPMLACVGRERVIVKDIRFPAVPAAEEAAVVRFQAVKELTDPAEEVVIDYMPVGDAVPGSDRRALVMVVRRELLVAYQTLCKSAGLKLAGLTPRQFGSVACLKHLPPSTAVTAVPESPGGAVAILTVSDRWAEFSVSRGDQPLFARSMGVGITLPGEVRRNLAVYAGQSPQHPIRTLYLAGTGDQATLRERLQELTGLPVVLMDPFGGSDRPELPSGHRGSFAGAVGLLHAYADKRGLPINFVKPREPRPQSDPQQRRLVLSAAVIGFLVIGLIGYCYAQVAAAGTEMQKLALEKIELDKYLTQTDDSKRLKALDDWASTDISWLDELYDLTARFPSGDKIRLAQLVGDKAERGAKGKYVGRMDLRLITTDDYTGVEQLLAEFVKDGSYQRHTHTQSRNAGVDRAFGFGQQYVTKVDVEKRPPEKFVRNLPALAKEADGGRRRGRGDAGDFGAGFGGFGGFGGDQ